MGKIILPGDQNDPANRPRDLADLWDKAEKTLSPHERAQLDFLKKQHPKEYALARVNEIRRRLSQVMCKVVADPKLLPNADLLDWMRDMARNKGLKFEAVGDKQQNGIMHTFMWDPKVERMDLRPWMGPQDGPENRCYLGWVEKNTEPTPDRGDGG